MVCNIGLTIYTILEFVAFVFVLVGTPIDMFRSKGQNEIGNSACLTMWGYKSECYSTSYDVKSMSTLFAGCPKRLHHFQAAEAFAIISIAVFAVCFILGLCMCSCCSSCACCCRVLLCILIILGIASAAVVWACMAASYNVDHNGDDSSAESIISDVNPLCYKLKNIVKYGAGFALIVVGWAIHTVNLLFALLPC